MQNDSHLEWISQGRLLPLFEANQTSTEVQLSQDVGCCTVCLARTTHKPEECPVRFKIRHYLCTKPGCNSKKKVCPDFRGLNPFSAHPSEVLRHNQPNFLNLAEYIPDESQPLKQDARRSKTNINGASIPKGKDQSTLRKPIVLTDRGPPNMYIRC